jgi:hypothetical protein
MPPFRGAKLSAVLNSVRRDEDKVRRVNFTDRALFTIAGGYDVKRLKNAITWCWETGSKIPGSVESYLRTSAEHLLVRLYSPYDADYYYTDYYNRSCHRYPR